MRKKMGTVGVVGLLACTALLTVAAATRFRPTLSKPTDSVGRITKTQIISLSEPLLQALLVGATKIDTSACPLTTFTSAGQTVHHWNIDCTDPKTGDTAHLLWNADTGELLRASHLRKHECYCNYVAVSPQKVAVGLAWDWFRAMKIERPSDEWRIVGARKKHYAQWDIYLRAGDHYSIVTVKTDSGQLIQVVTGRLPSATMAWAPFKSELTS
ncbi:MAG: hypothetical protein JWL77_5432 [Chthonomonadaceae bacterium]|nr:hypothetical protein [Chthonomonadaceae bacterium]